MSAAIAIRKFTCFIIRVRRSFICNKTGTDCGAFLKINCSDPELE